MTIINNSFPLRTNEEVATEENKVKTYDKKIKILREKLKKRDQLLREALGHVEWLNKRAELHADDVFEWINKTKKLLGEKE